MRLSTILKWILLLSFASAVVLWVCAIIFRVPVRADHLISMALTIAVTSLAALPCAICIEKGRSRLLMMSGLAASAAACAGWIVMIFTLLGVGQIDGAINVLSPAMVWAGFCSVVAVLTMQRVSSSAVVMLRRIAIGSSAALGLVVLVSVWFSQQLRFLEDTIVKLLGLFTALAAFATLTTLLLGRIHHLTNDEDEDDDREEVVRLDLAVTCPRCRIRQAMQTGGARCRSCGLSIRVAVP